MAKAEEPFRYKFRVLGHHDARLPDNEPHITVTFLAGHGDHLTYCGTLTMAEGEWELFSGALSKALGDSLEIEDTRVPKAASG
jgi:hypothetical protein